MEYRRDIDGLRAYAVLLVVMYHFGLPFLEKGFLGVDIFFVISGYLITSIIQNDIAAGKFSIAQFYERRIRRIFPALFFIIAFTLYIGVFIFMQVDFKAFALSALATIFFVSNIYFYNTINYFDTLADTKLLLHTWSLSVEEQFYILYPLMLFAISRFWKPRLVGILITLTVLSLAADIYFSHVDSQFAFFMFPTRAWQLLFGALAAVSPPLIRENGGKARNLLSLLILFGLIAPIFLWPALGLPEKAGTVLLCLTSAFAMHVQGRHETLPKQILSLRPAVAIGLISYSLYLWHWPLYVTFKSYAPVLDRLYGSTAVSAARLVVIALCFFMAWVSRRFVEQPFRRRRLCAGRRALFAFGCMGVLFFAVTAWYGHEGKLQPVLNMAKMRSYKYTDTGTYAAPFRNDAGFLVIGDPQATRRLLVVGDSHALQFRPFFYKKSQGGLFVAMRPDFLFDDHKELSAAAFAEKFIPSMIAYAHTHGIKDVLLINRWALRVKGPTQFEELYDVPYFRQLGITGASVSMEKFEKRLRLCIAELKKAGLRISLMTSVPEQDVNVPNFAHKMAFMLLKAEDCGVTPDEFARRQAPLPALFESLKSEVTLIEPARKMCTDTLCRMAVDGTLLYADDDHLSLEGTLLVGELFDSLLNGAEHTAARP